MMLAFMCSKKILIIIFITAYLRLIKIFSKLLQVREKL